MDLGISGRKAIVNGGSAGLGRSAVLALAREGVEVFVSARTEHRLLRTCEEIAQETGGRITPICADHSSAMGRAKILAACPDPDILVGTCAPPPLTPDYRAITDEQWRECIDISLLSPVEFMRSVLDGMVERKWGRVVNIATVAAKYPGEIRALSGSTRAALVNYTVAVSKVVAKHNVMINNLLPGMHHTATVHKQFSELAEARGSSYGEEVAAFAKEWHIPSERFGEADDVGAFVALFCSEYANYVTGQSLVIDGGATRSTF
ncbi:SDR family NAD(P)-dependent oxidoreductase [Rhizorhabdus dicambivorans]|uniref:Short-chain dehydrogenase n=1 Tax=Rhizorhabdus dicambivorans TaxID=1850238 RepID=A0A2A4FRQ7_9SPHN|nr:SDR family NAD(P)-dependent oxidoreductase [Rhizorhabdus dicambivorans]ATE65717.1 short-chain dehydrogenase [Rhizorhabdus dicambivorans]PCE40081.1 short-chain dehydrogenase [Rhizorhabdus dicambivorans]